MSTESNKNHLAPDDFTAPAGTPRRARRFSFSFSSKSQRVDSSMTGGSHAFDDDEKPLGLQDQQNKKSFSLRDWLGKKKKSENGNTFEEPKQPKKEKDKDKDKNKDKDKDKDKEKSSKESKSKESSHHHHHQHKHHHKHHSHSKGRKTHRDGGDSKKKGSEKDMKKSKTHVSELGSVKTPEIKDLVLPNEEEKKKEEEKEKEEAQVQKIDSVRYGGSFVIRIEDQDESSSSSSSSSSFLFSEDSFDSSSSSSSSSSMSQSSSTRDRSASVGDEPNAVNDISAVNDIPAVNQPSGSPGGKPLDMSTKSQSGPLLTVSAPPEKKDEKGESTTVTTVLTPTSPIVISHTSAASDNTGITGGSVPLRLFGEHSRAYRSGSCSRPRDHSQSGRGTPTNTNVVVSGKKKIPSTSGSTSGPGTAAKTKGEKKKPPPLGRTYSGYVRPSDDSPNHPLPSSDLAGGNSTRVREQLRSSGGIIVCPRRSPRQSPRQSPRGVAPTISLSPSPPSSASASSSNPSPSSSSGSSEAPLPVVPSVAPKSIVSPVVPKTTEVTPTVPSPSQSPGAAPKKVQVKTGHKCTCQHLDRHLWLPKCKKCFHPVSCHINGGACTYVEEEGTPNDEPSMPRSFSQQRMAGNHVQHPMVVVPGARVPTQQPRMGRASGENMAIAAQLLRSKSFVAIPNGQKRPRPSGMVTPGSGPKSRTPIMTPRQGSMQQSKSSQTLAVQPEDPVATTPTTTSTTTTDASPATELAESDVQLTTEKQEEEIEADMALVDNEEFDELRVVSERLANFLGESDDMPRDPIPLARVFELLVTSTIRASGMEDMPFAKDFLAAYSMALSTKEGYNKLEPLDDEQWRSLQIVGRTLWDLAGQQEFLRTLTFSQAFLATRAAQRRKEATKIWRTDVALKWLHGVIRVRNEERTEVQFLGSFEEQLAVRKVALSHQLLCAKLDKICTDYPAENAFTIGSVIKAWLAEAKPIYAYLYAAMTELKKNGKTESEQAEILLRIWTQLPKFAEKIKSIIDLYHELCAMEKLDEAVATRLKSDCQLLEESLATCNDLEATIVSEFEEQKKQNESESDSSTVGSVKSDRRKSRKKINELFAPLPEPTFLPANANRKMQCQGFLLASLSSDEDGKTTHASHHQFRFSLMNDALVLYTKAAKPQAVASMTLKDTVFFSRGDDGFVLCNPKVRMEVTKWKPERLLTMVRSNIAQLRSFGVDLDDVLAQEKDNDCGVPRTALRCMELIEQKGFSTEGLFRVNGNPGVMQLLRDALDRRVNIDSSSVRAHDVAQLFKKFLMEMPEPLLTTTCVKKLKKLNPRYMEEEQVVSACQDIFHSMPESYREACRVVFDFLSVCADQECRTKMGANNLATVFAPIFIREFHIPAKPFNVIDDSSLMGACSMDEMKAQISLIRIMIDNHLDLFL